MGALRALRATWRACAGAGKVADTRRKGTDRFGSQPTDPVELDLEHIFKGVAD